MIKLQLFCLFSLRTDHNTPQHHISVLIYYFFYSTSLIAQLVRAANHKLSGHRFKSYLKNYAERVSLTG